MHKNFKLIYALLMLIFALTVIYFFLMSFDQKKVITLEHDTTKDLAPINLNVESKNPFEEKIAEQRLGTPSSSILSPPTYANNSSIRDPFKNFLENEIKKSSASNHASPFSRK